MLMIFNSLIWNYVSSCVKVYQMSTSADCLHCQISEMTYQFGERFRNVSTLFKIFSEPFHLVHHLIIKAVLPQNGSIWGTYPLLFTWIICGGGRIFPHCISCDNPTKCHDQHAQNIILGKVDVDLNVGLVRFVKYSYKGKETEIQTWNLHANGLTIK